MIPDFVERCWRLISQREADDLGIGVYRGCLIALVPALLLWAGVSLWVWWAIH
jgi:hypothetical protein